MKIALYLRVSTGEQTVEPQRRELLDYCQRRGWTDVREFADAMSGAKWTRLGLNALMAEIRRGRIDLVLCVKLDRLGRSLAHLAQLAGELESHKVALVCTSQGIDTTDGNPAGKLQLGILMAVAEFERALIRERTNAGLEAAVARGSVLGRKPMVLSEQQRETLQLWASTDPRTGYATLAGALGVSIGTAHKLAKGALV